MGTIKMIDHLTSFILLLSSAAMALESTHVIGKFGNQRIPIDFRFGDNVMIVKTHRSANADDAFRETINLHIFSTHTVAIKNTADKECYVQPFRGSMNGMKKNVKDALRHKANLGRVKIERVMLAGSKPLPPKLVKLLLGPEIADFCHSYDVYRTGRGHSRLLHPNDIRPARRSRRIVPPTKIWNPDFTSPRWPWKRPSWKDFIVVC